MPSFLSPLSLGHVPLPASLLALALLQVWPHIAPPLPCQHQVLAEEGLPQAAVEFTLLLLPFTKLESLWGSSFPLVKHPFPVFPLKSPESERVNFQGSSIWGWTIDGF